eukprot:scaffold5637_cov47-Attheya_sp.AAC.3
MTITADLIELDSTVSIVRDVQDNAECVHLLWREVKRTYQETPLRRVYPNEIGYTKIEDMDVSSGLP